MGGFVDPYRMLLGWWSMSQEPSPTITDTFIRHAASTTSATIRSAPSTTTDTIRRHPSEANEWVRR